MHGLRNRSTRAALVLAAGALVLLPTGGSSAVTDEPVADLGNGVTGPRAAIGPAGDETVVWVRGGDPHEAVVVARRPSGGSWEEPVTVWSDGAFIADATVAAESSGAVTVIWWAALGSPSNRTYSVMSSRYVEGVWTTPAVLWTSLKMPAHLTLSVGSGGTAVAAWSTDAGVRAGVRTPEGTWGPTTKLSETTDDGFSLQAGVAADGSAVVSWAQSYWRPRMMVSRLQDNVWSAAQSLGRGGEATALVVAPDGSATVAWLRGPKRDAVVATRAMSADGTWSGTVVIGLGDSWHATDVGGALDLDLVGEDGVVLVWPEVRGFGPDTRLRVATGTGDEWTAGTAFRTDAEVVLLDLAVSWLPDGDLLLAWLQSPYYHQNPAKVQYAVRSDSGWSAPVRIHRKRGLQGMSSADDATGRLLLTWLDTEDYYDQRIHAAAITP